MRDWAQFFRLRSQTGLAEKISALAILASGIASFAPIAPPWPGKLALTFCSVVTSTAVIGMSFFFQTARARTSIKQTVVVLFIVLSILYLLIFSALVLQGETTKSVIVRGLWCSERALQIKVIASRCPFLSEEDLLGKDLDVDFFWPPLAIATSRWLLLTSWLGLCAILSFGAAQSRTSRIGSPVQSSDNGRSIAATVGSVFISYSSKDTTTAEMLCAALENRGFKCWFAPRDVSPGDNFQESIHRAIRSSKVMVLVFTSHANHSPEIKKEIVLAGQYSLVVIPARFEEIVPNDALAYELATRQWIDMFRNWDEGIGRLCLRISVLLTPDGIDGAGIHNS